MTRRVQELWLRSGIRALLSRRRDLEGAGHLGVVLIENEVMGA
ncbi:hypothetical protein [Thalassiella azotivora]